MPRHEFADIQRTALAAPAHTGDALVETAERLRQATGALAFQLPVAVVYRPLDYAHEAHLTYLVRYGSCQAHTLLLGMNPGPFGMCQTGIPFGDVHMVRDWLKIRDGVHKPDNEHPKRPVLGFDSPRAEVSGTRLWGWARARYESPSAFFAHFLVWNYCPLAFLEVSGRNRTPDKLPKAERASLFAACDEALREVVRTLGIRRVIGVGRFAAERARRAGLGEDIDIHDAPHPSPANPAANRDWAGAFERALTQSGLLR